MILCQENMSYQQSFSLMKNLNADQKVSKMADKLKIRVLMRAVSNLKFSMPMLSSLHFLNVKINMLFQFQNMQCATKGMQIHTYTSSHINDIIGNALL